MSFSVRQRLVHVAVQCVFRFGKTPCRVMGVQTFFPDIGVPVTEKVGYLRYPGEPFLGDVEPAATGPASGHLNDRSIENG